MVRVSVYGWIFFKALTRRCLGWIRLYLVASICSACVNALAHSHTEATHRNLTLSPCETTSRLLWMPGAQSNAAARAVAGHNLFHDCKYDETFPRERACVYVCVCVVCNKH